MVRLELATPGLQTQLSSHWAKQLKSYSWEGVEFLQLVYCIIIYFIFSQLWLTSHPRSTVALLDTRTPGSSREIYSEDTNLSDSNSEPLDYKPTALAIERYSSEAIAGKELSLSSWCIASLYIYLLSPVIDFSSETYSGSAGHRNSCYQERNLHWIWQWSDSNSQPLDCKPTALAIELYSSKAIAGKGLSLSSWCIASLYVYLFSIVIDFSFEKNSGSTGDWNSWYQ